MNKIRKLGGFSLNSAMPMAISGQANGFCLLLTTLLLDTQTMIARSQAQKESSDMFMEVSDSFGTGHNQNRVRDQAGAIRATRRQAQTFSDKFFQYLLTEALSTSKNAGYSLLMRKVLYLQVYFSHLKICPIANNKSTASPHKLTVVLRIFLLV